MNFPTDLKTHVKNGDKPRTSDRFSHISMRPELSDLFSFTFQMADVLH